MTMSGLAAGELQWEYPKTPDDPYLLRDGTSEVARLWFAEEPWEKSHAELSGSRWSLVHTAGRHMRIAICRGDPEEEVAVFERGLAGGVVTFAGGTKYRWRKRGLRPGRWCFRREGDRSSVCVSQLAGPLARGARVTVCPGAAAQPETPVLVLLAWYLRILEYQAEMDRMYVAG
jgi:hypothetical protein